MFYLELGGEQEQYEGKPQREDSDWTDQHPSKITGLEEQDKERGWVKEQRAYQKKMRRVENLKHQQP